jgi:hypothetical protein
MGRYLKLLRQASLFENAVCGMARPDFPIHGETEFRERAVPDFMITFALAFKTAAIFG